MNGTARPRDTDFERMERSGFVVLQHLLTLEGEATSSQLPTYLAADLAIPLEETQELLRLLTLEGMVSWPHSLGPARVTPEGAEYVLYKAGRRRSVRRHRAAAGR